MRIKPYYRRLGKQIVFGMVIFAAVAMIRACVGLG
jgi:hypothetical protein